METPLSEQVDRLLDGSRPLQIVPAGLAVLRRPADPFDGQLTGDTLGRLICAMREAMRAAPGVGLAAPQIGVSLQIAVLEDAAEVSAEIAAARDRRPLPFTVLINPQCRQMGTERATFFEGCLSVPGYQAAVDRAFVVAVSALDETGSQVHREYRGWQARIAQHETDHLGGVLYLDRAAPRSLAQNDVYQAKWAGPSIDAARQALGF